MMLSRKTYLTAIIVGAAASSVQSFSMKGRMARRSFSIRKMPEHSSLAHQAALLSKTKRTSTQLYQSKEEPSSTISNLVSIINPLYLGLWVTFLTYGLFLSPGQVGSPMDNAMIQAYIDNPQAPVGINPIFLIIFNGLGVMPLVVSQLACPQGSRDGAGIPGAPLLAGSLAMGYGAAGLYLGFRGTPVNDKTQQEASWFTRNVLESKLTSVASIGLLGAGVYSATQAVAGLTGGWATAASDFGDLLQASKFANVSTCDLAILTVAAATLIPRDLQLRSKDDPETAKLGPAIAVASVFAPILGAALYCLWRPNLPEE